MRRKSTLHEAASGEGGSGLGGLGAGASGGAAGSGVVGGHGGAVTGGSSGVAGAATGGSSGVAGAATGGSAGVAGMESDGGAGGSFECTPVDDPDPTRPEDCPELERLVLSNPEVEDSDGDGRVSPGERATVRVVERDASGLGYSSYPGVIFESDDSAVEFVTETHYFSVFALLACQSLVAQVDVVVGDVPPETVVHVTARAGSLNRECPDAPSLVIPITVR